MDLAQFLKYLHILGMFLLSVFLLLFVGGFYLEIQTVTGGKVNNNHLVIISQRGGDQANFFGEINLEHERSQ